jgi:tetratricopeptide (TPR) repeat protein
VDLGMEKLGIVAVDTGQSTASEVRAVLASETLSFPVLLDPQRTLYGKIGVIVTPTTLIVDGRGTLEFVLASHPRQFRQVIRARLKHLLGDITSEQLQEELKPTVLAIDHNVAAAWRMYNLGKTLETEGKSKAAMAAYEEAIKRHSSLSEARCALGFLKLSEGDFEAAAQQFGATLAEQPSLPLARLGQAAVLARTAQEGQAETILLSLVGQPSIAARVRYELGRIYQGRGETEKAVTFFEDALASIFAEPSAAVTKRAPPQPRKGGKSPSATAPGVAVALPDSTALRTAGKVDIRPVVPPADARYIGVKRCKKCHFQQWRSWQDTKMAKALALLKPGVRGEVKVKRNLNPQQDYGNDTACLVCHSTGFGFPGGYPSTPPAEPRAMAAAKEFAAVGCEACHGPGSQYSLVHKEIQDKKRKYSQQELYDAGQYKVDASVCVVCHNEKAPCIALPVVFDFEQRKQQGTHKHYQLQFRAQ